MSKKPPFQDEYYFPRGFGSDRTPRVKSYRTHPIPQKKLPTPQEKAPDIGTSAAIYLGFIFALAMAEAQWSRERAKKELRIGTLPTTGGAGLYTPHSLRIHKVTDNLFAAAPKIMNRKGLGDVLRAYENGTLTPDLFDPQILALINDHLKSGRTSGNDVQALRTKIFGFCGIPLPRAGTLRRASPPPAQPERIEPNPIPPQTVYEAIGQENYLHQPDKVALWEKMNLDKRRKAIEIESAKVYKSGQIAQSWKACAARLAAHLPRDLKTPKTDDPAVLLAAYTAPFAPSLPTTPLGRRAYYLLQFAPKADK